MWNAILGRSVVFLWRLKISLLDDISSLRWCPVPGRNHRRLRTITGRWRVTWRVLKECNAQIGKYESTSLDICFGRECHILKVQHESKFSYSVGRSLLGTKTLGMSRQCNNDKPLRSFEHRAFPRWEWSYLVLLDQQPQPQNLELAVQQDVVIRLQLVVICCFIGCL